MDLELDYVVIMYVYPHVEGVKQHSARFDPTCCVAYVDRVKRVQTETFSLGPSPLGLRILRAQPACHLFRVVPDRTGSLCYGVVDPQLRASTRSLSGLPIVLPYASV